MDLNVEPAPFLWIEEGKAQIPTPRTRRRTKKKKEFLGWASRQLIVFLELIGKQTDQPISQHDITNFINQYVNERKLLHPEKKKKVLCDERLHALFGRKSVNRNKIHDLLDAHLAENQVGSDDDLFYSSEEREEDVLALSKRQKVSSSDKKSVSKKKVEGVSKSCLAAISRENMKHMYLKRTLVEELLKDPENFETKVVGSFVRIKSDPHDIFQKNSHVIHLVTGVRSVAAAGDNSSHILLQISGMPDYLSISELSDDDFTEDEIDDLLKRVKDGLLKQPTVGELEEKAKVLHEDITKHWLARELVLLKKLIDRANEKGWRHKVTEYLDKRKLLQTPSEQSRLLSEIPKIMPEEVKQDTVVEGSPDAVNEEADDSPKAIHWDWEPYSPAKEVMINFSSVPENQGLPLPSSRVYPENVEIATRINCHAQSLSIKDKGGLPDKEVNRAKSNGHATSFEPRERIFPREEAMTTEVNVDTKPSIPEHIDLPSSHSPIQASNGRSNQSPPRHGAFAREINVHAKPSIQDHITLPSSIAVAQANNGHLQPLSLQPKNTYGMNGSQKKPVEVIDLSDDDEEQEPPRGGGGGRVNGCPVFTSILEQMMWHYVDPRGNVQGPFSLSSLKRWRDAKYFKDTFRVWKAGQSPHESVLLTDIIRQFFPS